MIKLDGKTVLVWAILVFAFLVFVKGDFVLLPGAWLQRLPSWALLPLLGAVFLGVTLIMAIAVRLALRLFSR